MRKCKGIGPALVIGREAVHGWLFGGYMDCGISDVPEESNGGVKALTNPSKRAEVWERRDGPWGAYRNPALWCMRWNHTLGAKAGSVLEWETSTFWPSFGSWSGTELTGTDKWTAADVLNYRV